MSAMKLLEGAVEPEDPRDEQIADLEDQVQALRTEVTIARAAAVQATREASRALANLRRQLSPLYRALQDVFGELDAAGVAEAAPSAQTSADPRWASWKQKMPGRPAELIDLLLLHGDMNRNQLMAAMHAGKDVVRVTVSKLNVAGLLNKTGGRYSLKTL